MFVGGDVFEIQVNHDTLGDRTFEVKADEEFTLDPGGFRTEDEDSSITGNGESIDKISRKRWSAEGPVVWDISGSDELDFLRQLAADPLPATYTFSHVSGAVHTGKGKPVGDLKGSMKDAMIPVKFSGGQLVKKL